MQLQDWIGWTQEQLGDLSRRLVNMGYTPDRVFALEETAPEFKEKFDGFMYNAGEIIDLMAVEPEDLNHFERFTAAKMEFLDWAIANKAQFLPVEEKV